MVKCRCRFAGPSVQEVRLSSSSPSAMSQLAECTNAVRGSADRLRPPAQYLTSSRWSEATPTTEFTRRYVCRPGCYWPDSPPECLFDTVMGYEARFSASDMASGGSHRQCRQWGGPLRRRPFSIAAAGKRFASLASLPSLFSIGRGHRTPAKCYVVQSAFMHV